ncbi:hypothetical protein K437DRAFT_143626 [Tilletiaria anomala UBC 951]|uniref:NAD(P)-binding protein n=1 Tax=Tilletiaria anomala (strain ATCC 24038 / CBS 436.72 / UBC 951) TaxID=1037660 RepID=A0A066VQE0_TILAU|nr:uncharacterized protein K437DRAFT_143626 [Tilletiaria anomala UBC 951]KDN43942.1 hypothetical protein K437DRAFT_143626 [Tilletiaria anomala UBC 951]
MLPASRKSAARGSLKGAKPRRAGTVVNIASIAALITSPFGAAYDSSKSVMRSLSDALHLELGPLGVKVIAVLPGKVLTRFGENAIASVEKRAKSAEPEADGFYSHVQDLVCLRAAFGQMGKTMSPEDLARRIIEHIDRDATTGRFQVAEHTSPRHQ